MNTQSYLKKILHFFYKGESIGNMFFILAKVVILPNFVPESPMKQELNCISCVYLYWFGLALYSIPFFCLNTFFPLLLEIGPSGILWGTMYVNFISPSLKKKKNSSLVYCSLTHPLFFLAHCVACWVLDPWPGIEPVLPALGAQTLNHWTTRELPPAIHYY